MTCTRCGSYAINHHAHGRDGSDRDLCDVCYWRKRAQRTPLSNVQISLICDSVYEYLRHANESDNLIIARAIEAAHGIILPDCEK